MKAPLTGQDFYRFYQCPLWPYWERFGDPADRRPLTAAEEERMADGLAHERAIVERQFQSLQEVAINDPKEGVKATIALMESGAPLIYQAWLADGEWLGRPDILERQPGKSRFGNYFYTPVDIKRAHSLKKEHKAQLSFYCALLERVQGAFPGHPAIINADGERIVFSAEEFLPEFQEILGVLERIRDGQMPEFVFRKSSVDTSPWGKATERLMVERDDIALLYNVDLRRLRALRSLGIETVRQAAEIDPEALEAEAPGLTLRGLESAKRQAVSLRDQSVMIREPFTDPTDELEIHFDIESHPPTDTDYLYGILEVRPEGATYRAFLAERPEDEKKMWKEFLHWIATLPERYTVYHYAPYEVQRLRELADRYGDATNPDLERFVERLHDLKETARDHVVFPVYFYSLKAIAKFLGYRWEGDVHSGGDSVIVFDRWLETGARHLLDSIVKYNEHDVRATAFLLNWLRRYAGQEDIYRKPYPWTSV